MHTFLPFSQGKEDFGHPSFPFEKTFIWLIFVYIVFMWLDFMICAAEGLRRNEVDGEVQDFYKPFYLIA